MTAQVIAAPRRYRGVEDQLRALGVSTPPGPLVVAQLSDPVLPVADLALRTGSSASAALGSYRALRGDEEIAAFVGSLFYSHRLVWAAAAATVSDWKADPERPARLLAGEPVMSRTVELHASKGTCDTVHDVPVVRPRPAHLPIT